MHKNVCFSITIVSMFFHGFTYSMFCQLVQKAQKSTKHRIQQSHYTATSYQDAYYVSKHCFNQLHEVDFYTQNLIRYFTLHLHNTRIQQQTGGRPSLIIKQALKNAPQSTCYDIHNLFLSGYAYDIHDIYQPLDESFEQIYTHYKKHFPKQKKTSALINSVLQHKDFTNSLNQNINNLAYKVKLSLIRRDHFSPDQQILCTPSETTIIVTHTE